jgi:hypothetical protein
MAASRALAQACAIFRRGGFHVSPNWWADELVTSGLAAVPDDDANSRSVLQSMWAPRGAARHLFPSIQIAPDAVLVDGQPLPPGVWREGKSGRRLLDRLFHTLCEAGERGMTRDELCDCLWPDSDGDRAVRNLYAAVHDLRRLLAALPGARLSSREGRYCMELGENVSVQTHTRVDTRAHPARAMLERADAGAHSENSRP